MSKKGQPGQISRKNMRLKKRILYGNIVIAIATIISIIMGFVCDWMIKNFGHPTRFTIIFGVSGFIWAIVSVWLATFFYSDGFKKGAEEWQDESDYKKSGEYEGYGN